MKKYMLVPLLICLLIFSVSCGGDDDDDNGTEFSLGGHYGGWMWVWNKSAGYERNYTLWGELDQSGSIVTGTLTSVLGFEFVFNLEVVGNVVTGTIDSGEGILNVDGTTDGVTISGTVNSAYPQFGVVEGTFNISKGL